VEKLWAIRRIGEILDEIDLKGKNDELTKELVMLSTKHGLLTPYTSFLADENAPHNLAQNLSLTRDRLEAFSEVSGGRGVALRINKDFYRSASAAEAKSVEAAFEGLYDRDSVVQSLPAAAQPGATAVADFGATDARAAKAYGLGGGVAGPASRLAGGAGGYGSANGNVAGRPAATALPITERELAERAKVVENVRRIGNKSFFRRGDRWVDSTVDALDDADAKKAEKVKKIKRFSDEYFKLVDKHGKDVAKYLAFDEPVTLMVDGQVYEFVE
jgi:Ca-activated chloride channel family protein